MEKNIRNSRRLSISHFPSFLNGTFGWTVNQVHANVVAKQFQRMFHIVRSWQSVAIVASRARRGGLEEYVLRERGAPSVKLLRDRSIAAIVSSIRRVVCKLLTEEGYIIGIGGDLYMYYMSAYCLARSALHHYYH